MGTVHWVDEAGLVEAQSVCAVDFNDSGMAVDFAHNLYRAVHEHGRSKSGFAIKDDAGKLIYGWRWDGGPTGIALAEDASVPQPERSTARFDLERAAVSADAGTKKETGNPQRLLGVPSTGTGLVALHRLERGLRAARGVLNLACARLAAYVRDEPSARPASPRPVRKDGAAKRVAARRFAPDVELVERRAKPGIDHYLLALFAILFVLGGSPLYAVYSTVQRFQIDDAFVQQDKSGVAAATRSATAAVLSTDGQLDFRKLFWHLRLVGPTQLDLLAYDPDEGSEGPRLVFKTDNLLRWHLRSVRGANGTWVAATESGSGCCAS